MMMSKLVLEDNTTVPINLIVQFHGTGYFVVPSVQYYVVGTVVDMVRYLPR
jgi:hypothetical protein